MRRRDGGQSLVEFSLVFPLLLLFMLAIVDGGRAIFAYNQMSQITRAVARVASVSCFETTPRCDWQTPGTPLAVAIAENSAGFQSGVSWTVECVDPASINKPSPAPSYTTHSLDGTGTPCNVGDIVRVNATQTFNLLYLPLAGDFGKVGVGSTSVQQILQ